MDARAVHEQGAAAWAGPAPDGAQRDVWASRLERRRKWRVRHANQRLERIFLRDLWDREMEGGGVPPQPVVPTLVVRTAGGCCSPARRRRAAQAHVYVAAVGRNAAAAGGD
uniref:Uncharacterized protein n=1 Tax=Hemiselmis tepida TaxID=464990 RepID=A0A7S0W647_9CRYP|mmetsp:Transcript_6149/g.15731  ORF Transcript_6149/g.15731 Transcript_6149/m.15731 type:complete len:111 (+) Transcript_6149:326-658(+)